MTVHAAGGQVVRIVPNWKEGSKKRKRKEYFTYYEFIPDPSGKLLGLGFGQLMRSLGKTANSLINQLLDAGTLANAGGGLIDKRTKIKPGTIEGRINKWILADIDPQGKPFVEFPRPTPNATLFTLLGFVVDAAKEVSATTDLMTGDLTKNMQPTTVLAMIEQGTKVFNAIYKRVYRALKREYKNLALLNYEYANPAEYFAFQDSEEFIYREDFDPAGIDIIPASDPNMVSDATEMAKAGVVQSLMGHPHMNQKAALEQVLRSAKVEPKGLVVEQMPPDPNVEADKAKLENDAARIQNETQRVRAEVMERQAKMDREGAKLNADLASKPMELQNEMRSAALEEQRIELELRKIELDTQRLNLEIANLGNEHDLTKATVLDKIASAGAKELNSETTAVKAVAEIERADRQEDRADRTELRDAMQPKEQNTHADNQ